MRRGYERAIRTARAGYGRFTRNRRAIVQRLAADGSIVADHVPRPGSAVYAMTKAAVAGLTRGLATNWVAWDHGQRHPAGSDRDRRISGCGRIRHAMRDRTALAHYGRPEDIASAVAYLASPDAGFITGFSWNVDGGFAA